MIECQMAESVGSAEANPTIASAASKNSREGALSIQLARWDRAISPDAVALFRAPCREMSIAKVCELQSGKSFETEIDRTGRSAKLEE
jgi:hypothetical protein